MQAVARGESQTHVRGFSAYFSEFFFKMIFDWVEFLVLEGTVIWWIGVLLNSLHKPKYKLNYQSLFANVSPQILDSKNGRNLHIVEIGNQYSLLIKANSFITIQPIIKEKVNSQRSIEFKLLHGFLPGLSGSLCWFLNKFKPHWSRWLPD